MFYSIGIIVVFALGLCVAFDAALEDDRRKTK